MTKLISNNKAALPSSIIIFHFKIVLILFTYLDDKAILKKVQQPCLIISSYSYGIPFIGIYNTNK